MGSAPTGGPAPRVLPGALTKPVAQYSADEFFDFVSNLQYAGGTERERLCRNAQGCGNGGTRRTKVFIEAIATQDSLGRRSVPEFGVVYARVANRGNAQESRYGFLPGARYQYYVIITADSGGMRWHLQQLDVTAGGRSRTEIASGAFRGCGHAWRAGARADFKTCAEAASGRDSIVHLGLLLQGNIDAPIWVACDEGCCTADT